MVLLHGFGDTVICGRHSPPIRPGITRSHTSLYASAPCAQSSPSSVAFVRDEANNKASMATRLTMPLLAIGGEKSFGSNEAIVMRNAADKVTEVVIPGIGHWLMEEAPTQTIQAIRDFFAQ